MEPLFSSRNAHRRILLELAALKELVTLLVAHVLNNDAVRVSWVPRLFYQTPQQCMHPCRFLMWAR
jgi:hypothetical protein